MSNLGSKPAAFFPKQNSGDKDWYGMKIREAGAFQVLAGVLANPAHAEKSPYDCALIAAEATREMLRHLEGWR